MNTPYNIIQTDGRRMCVRCGAYLSLYHKSNVCYDHVRDYDPRLDGHWEEKLVDYLTENIGGEACPHAHFGICCAANYVVKRNIKSLRRQGWEIEYVVGKRYYLVKAAPH